MKKILAVDDDKYMRNLVSGVLSQEGYEVQTAENGVEGLEQLKTFKPNLIISDVLMPEMDGYEFCTKIRDMPETRHLPILMLTSLDSVEQKIKGFDVGADEYIVKPFEPREFQVRVANLIKRGEQFHATPLEEKATGKNIAVFSLRGGAGVSTIASNLAVGMAQLWGYPTALVDMVMIGGQSALYLNQPLKNTWAEIADFPVEEIDDQLVQSALLPHESGVFTLASPRRPERGESVTVEKVTSVLSILKDTHEYLVLDLPHDFNATTLAALDAADTILIILQPEIVSIRSAVIVLETFVDLGYDMDQIHIVLNWTFSQKGISISEIEKSLGKKISMVFPNAADEMLQGLNLGTPPTFTAPEEPLGVLFEDLALALGKDEHRKVKPAEPTAAWLRAAKRYRAKRKK